MINPLNKTRYFFILVCFAIILPHSLYSQSFEGVLQYNIKYHCKAPKIKNRYLIKDLGNAETVFIKNGLLKAERKYKSNILKTTIFRQKDSVRIEYSPDFNYNLLTHLNKEFNLKFKKADLLVQVGKYLCEVYTCLKDYSTYTFYVWKDKRMNAFNPSSVWYYYKNPFDGPIIKLTVENYDFLSEQTLVSMDEKALDNKIFEPINCQIVISPNELASVLLKPETRKDLQKYLNQDVGYPAMLQLLNLEGRVYVDFIINNKGEISSPQVVPNYFRKINQYYPIYNKQKTNRICHLLEKKLIRSFNKCLKITNIEKYPDKNGKENTVIRLSVVFSHYTSDDYDFIDFDFDNGYEIDDYDYYDGYFD